MFKTCSILLKTQIPPLIYRALQTYKSDQHIVNNSYFGNIYFVSEDYIMKTSGMQKTKEGKD
ncbi:hypothetical protein [Draconibacterium sediminis]|uniref:hypothetical protein n=1 Tax=Draconibacterium sediminis TaxID=1544798 RepID=UPI0026EEC3EB|nr:hypothetical protein [Draconibacterium sediminis]